MYGINLMLRFQWGRRSRDCAIIFHFRRRLLEGVVRRALRKLYGPRSFPFRRIGDATAFGTVRCHSIVLIFQ
jgi:hypothetical protein